MLLPTLPYFYINSKNLSIIVEFVYIVIIEFYCDRDEEHIILYIPMQCKWSDRKYVRQ